MLESQTSDDLTQLAGFIQDQVQSPTRTNQPQLRVGPPRALAADGRVYTFRQVPSASEARTHIDCPCWASGAFQQVPCPFHDGMNAYPYGAFAASVVQHEVKLYRNVDPKVQLGPLGALLDAIIQVGGSDIYTDAPEYEGRVAAMSNLIELLQAYRAGTMTVTLDSVSAALAPRELDEEDENEEDSPGGNDLCDLCSRSGVQVSGTTYCGKTVGFECGCDDTHSHGTCDDPACEDCLDEIVKPPAPPK